MAHLSDVLARLVTTLDVLVAKVEDMASAAESQSELKAVVVLYERLCMSAESLGSVAASPLCRMSCGSACDRGTDGATAPVEPEGSRADVDSDAPARVCDPVFVTPLTARVTSGDEAATQ